MAGVDTPCEGVSPGAAPDITRGQTVSGVTPAHGQGGEGPRTPAAPKPAPHSPPPPAVALPPEKTDGLASGDEKRMEKPSEPCPGSKKQLKFEVRFLFLALGRGRRASCLRGAF